MRKNCSILYAICILCLGLTQVSAQETIPATGGEATGSGGTVNYTIGQVAYSTNPGTSGSLTEGVQQPYEISVVSGIDEAKNIDITISAYPNPTSDFFTLTVNEMEQHEVESLSYQVYDLNGKLLENKKIKSDKTEISLTGKSHASYMVMILKNNQAIKIFKIIKK